METIRTELQSPHSLATAYITPKNARRGQLSTVRITGKCEISKKGYNYNTDLYNN